MKDFETIGKKMPFAEREDYVRQLVSNATEKALRQGSNGQRAKVMTLRTWIATAAAVVLLLAGVGLTYFNQEANNEPLVAENQEKPLDQFLDTLSDEELQLLAYYEVNEAPEYDEFWSEDEY